MKPGAAKDLFTTPAFEEIRLRTLFSKHGPLETGSFSRCFILLPCILGMSRGSSAISTTG